MKIAAAAALLTLAASAALPALAQTPAPAATQSAPIASEADLLKKAESLQADLHNLVGSVDIEPINPRPTHSIYETYLAAIHKRIDEITTQLDRVDLDMAEKETRAKLTAEKIAQLTDHAKEQIKDDKILEQLKIAAAGAEEEVNRRQTEMGSTMTADFKTAIAAAAEAHVKVEERIESFFQSAGGGILPALNRDLVTLFLDTEVLKQTRTRLEQKRDNLEQGIRTYKAYYEVANEIYRTYHHDITAPK